MQLQNIHGFKSLPTWEEWSYMTTNNPILASTKTHNTPTVNTTKCWIIQCLTASLTSVTTTCRIRSTWDTPHNTCLYTTTCFWTTVGALCRAAHLKKMEIQFWNNHTHTFLENSRTRVQIQEQYVTFRKVSKLKSKSKKVCIYYRLKIIFNIQILCLIWVYS